VAITYCLAGSLSGRSAPCLPRNSTPPGVEFGLANPSNSRARTAAPLKPGALRGSHARGVGESRGSLLFTRRFVAHPGFNTDLYKGRALRRGCPNQRQSAQTSSFVTPWLGRACCRGHAPSLADFASREPLGRAGLAATTTSKRRHVPLCAIATPDRRRSGLPAQS
jgi:hypothetical protein